MNVLTSCCVSKVKSCKNCNRRISRGEPVMKCTTCHKRYHPVCVGIGMNIFPYYTKAAHDVWTCYPCLVEASRKDTENIYKVLEENSANNEKTSVNKTEELDKRSVDLSDLKEIQGKLDAIFAKRKRASAGRHKGIMEKENASCAATVQGTSEIRVMIDSIFAERKRALAGTGRPRGIMKKENASCAAAIQGTSKDDGVTASKKTTDGVNFGGTGIDSVGPQKQVYSCMVVLRPENSVEMWKQPVYTKLKYSNIEV